MRITEELLKRGTSRNGGWNKEQLEILGVSWPPIKGWKYRIIGQNISDKDAERFLKLRRVFGVNGKALKHTDHPDLNLW